MSSVVMLVAFIRLSRQVAVAQALKQLGASGWTEGPVTGHGAAIGGHGVAAQPNP